MPGVTGRAFHSTGRCVVGGYFRHRQSIPGGDGGFGGRFGSGGFGGCIRDGGILLVFGFGSDFGTSW
jgi:hypothetical protein